MEYGFITFRSVTVAQRAERSLERSGIGCTLQRTPKYMAERGCSYCLRLRQRNMEGALAVLRRENIPISKVWGGEEMGS